MIRAGHPKAIIGAEMRVKIHQKITPSVFHQGAVRHDSFFTLSNVRDQRRRAVGAPLARETLWIPLAVPASGVTTSAERCIA